MRCQKSKIFEHPQKSKISGNSETIGFRVIRKKQSFFQMKSQITIFIVLGIVIVIIFGLLFFVRNATSDAVFQKEINKIYDDFLSSTNAKHVSNDCLDKTAKEALLLVGLQGGRIYDYQIRSKGYHIGSFYDVVPFNYTSDKPNGIIYNVSYGIRAPKNIPYPSPPNYPYLGSLVEDVLKSSIASFFINPNDQIFADVPQRGKFTILSDLCNRQGPNDPLNFRSFEPGVVSCETYSIKNESIQEYIKQYVEQNVKDCINFTLKKTYSYNISAGELSLNVLLGEDDLLISLNYPIEISIKGKPPITKYLDFNIRLKVRIKIIHEMASHLIGYNPLRRVPIADSNNIFFNISKDDPNDCYNGTSQCIVPGINILKLQDYCLNNHHCNFNNSHYNYSDILVIEDYKSIIYGKPYRFQFAIENRRPALDFIDESVSSDKYYFKYVNKTYGKNLTELYSNDGTGHPISNDYNILVRVPQSVPIYILGVDPDEDGLIYSYSVLDYGWPVLIMNITPNILAIFGGRLIDVAYTTIRINVSDNEGLHDYQDIKIKVI